MKRKDMIIKIHNLLKKEEYIGIGYYEMATILLKLVEEEGMAPPKTKVKLNKNPKFPELFEEVHVIRMWDEE